MLLPMRLIVCLGVLFWGMGTVSAQQAPASESDSDVQEEEQADQDPSGRAAMRREALDDEAARALFQAADSLYEGGRFIDAGRQFEAAFELSGRASLMFNAYLAYRDAGQLDDAIRCLALYLERVPDAPDHARLSNRLIAMREAQQQAQEEEAAVEAERARLQAETAEAERLAQAERERAEAERLRADEAGRRHPAGFVVGAIGVGSLITGGVMAIIANGRHSDLESACNDGICPANIDVENRRAELVRAQRATDGLLYTGAALTLTGILLVFVLPRRSQRDGGVTPSAQCDGQGCGLSLHGSF